MNLRFTASLFSLVAWMASASAQQTPPTFPDEPAHLLKVLPTAPEGWKVLRSQADLTLGEWLESKATRVFQSPAPAVAVADEAGNAGVAAPPGEIEVTVVDTAGFAPALAAFANFTPVKSATFEKKWIGALSSIVITNENGRQFVQVLVASRYIVTLTLSNLPRHRAEDWLRGFHFETLPAKSRTPTVQGREFRLSHLDELEPGNNRSYLVSTTNSQRVDAFLKTLPPSPPEAAVGTNLKP